MSLSMNIGLLKLSEKLDCDYPFAVGLFFLLKEMDEDGRLDVLNTRQIVHELGIMSRDMSQKLSRINRDTMRDIVRDIKRDIKRDKDRDRQRNYRERKRGSLSSPLSPTPSLPPIIPPEKERENAPLSLRERPPEGAHAPETLEMRRSSRFVKPTLEDVQAYCAERQNKVDAERFVAYYESNGWRVGRNPMRDWRAAIRSWEHNNNPLTGRSPEWKNPALNYKQREYTNEEYGDDFFIDLENYEPHPNTEQGGGL